MILFLPKIFGTSTRQKYLRLSSQAKFWKKKGVKQIGRISSAERGVLVTMCCCINAIGNALLPVYIFPQVHFKNYMLKDAPAGRFGLAYPSGWMTGALFAETLGHFIKFMKISKRNPGLLLIDNHISHLSIEAIDMTKEGCVYVHSHRIVATSYNHLILECMGHSNATILLFAIHG